MQFFPYIATGSQFTVSDCFQTQKYLDHKYSSHLPGFLKYSGISKAQVRVPFLIPRLNTWKSLLSWASPKNPTVTWVHLSRGKCLPFPKRMFLVIPPPSSRMQTLFRWGEDGNIKTPQGSEGKLPSLKPAARLACAHRFGALLLFSLKHVT